MGTTQKCQLIHVTKAWDEPDMDLVQSYHFSDPFLSMKKNRFTQKNVGKRCDSLVQLRREDVTLALAFHLRIASQ